MATTTAAHAGGGRPLPWLRAGGQGGAAGGHGLVGARISKTPQIRIGSDYQAELPPLPPHEWDPNSKECRVIPCEVNTLLNAYDCTLTASASERESRRSLTLSQNPASYAWAKSQQQTARTRTGVGKAITELAPDLEEGDTFIDVGSGLGSIVWGVAYHNPLLRCIGVENHKYIHRDAEEVRDQLNQTRIGLSHFHVSLVHCDAIEYLSKTANAGIIYCYDQGIDVGICISRPSNHTLPPPFSRGVRPWYVCFAQNIKGMTTALSNINFKYLMVSSKRKVDFWLTNCKGIEYTNNTFKAYRGAQGGGNYTVHVFKKTSTTATPVELSDGRGGKCISRPPNTPVELSDGRGGKRISRPPNMMGMVLPTFGLEKSMAQNVLVLGGALNGLTCAHTLPSHSRTPSHVTLILPPVLFWRARFTRPQERRRASGQGKAVEAHGANCKHKRTNAPRRVARREEKKGRARALNALLYSTKQCCGLRNQ